MNTEGLYALIKIGNVTIYQSKHGNYICFQSDLDICNDGTGPPHGDKHHQSQTAYYNGGKYLNADKDKYIVVPPQVRSLVEPVVMGCKARLTNTKSGVAHDAVVGDIGPSDKTGEAAYCLAKIVNPSISHNHGDTHHIYLFELWPGIAAKVGQKHYQLEPA